MFKIPLDRVRLPVRLTALTTPTVPCNNPPKEPMVRLVVVALVVKKLVVETDVLAVSVVPVAAAKVKLLEEIMDGAEIVPVAEIEVRTVLVESRASNIFPVCVEVT